MWWNFVARTHDEIDDGPRRLAAATRTASARSPPSLPWIHAPGLPWT